MKSNILWYLVFVVAAILSFFVALDYGWRIGLFYFILISLVAMIVWFAVWVINRPYEP